jgi:hypothetical protein
VPEPPVPVPVRVVVQAAILPATKRASAEFLRFFIVFNLDDTF